MPREREDAASSSHVRQAEHKVPFRSWKQVVVRDSQDAKSVFDSVLFQSFEDLTCIELEEHAPLHPVRDLMMLQKVGRNSFHHSLRAVPLLLLDLVPSPYHLDGQAVVKSLTVGLVLFCQILRDGFVDEEEVDALSALVDPGSVCIASLVLLDVLTLLFLRDEPVALSVHCLGLESFLSLLKHRVQDWVRLCKLVRSGCLTCLCPQRCCHIFVRHRWLFWSCWDR